jgi:hypothetical protein
MVRSCALRKAGRRLMSTLVPRSCGPQAWSAWQRDGRRLMWGTLQTWGALYLGIGIGLSYLATQSFWMLLPLVVALVWLHGAAHALFVHQARPEPEATGWSVVRADWKARKSWYLREMQRAALLLAVLMFMVLTLHSNSPPSAAVQGAESLTLPWWWTTGLFWMLGSTVVFLSRPLSGLTLHQDLGKTWEISWRQSLQLASRGWFRDNMPATVQALPRVTFLPLVCFLLPFLWPLMELWWLGILRCAYLDMFNQGKAVEEKLPELVPAPTRG